METLSSDLARRLAARAIDVCRHYLPSGRKVGGYWIAGDARGAKGKSLYVRLTGPLSGKGAAGRWSDGATGEYGDLLDLIAAACRLSDHRDVLEEARRFLNASGNPRPPADRSKPFDAAAAARRLFAASRPITGARAETYLKGRGILDTDGMAALRFHPRCFYRDGVDSPVQYWPALIAAVTEETGAISGVMRTYLARDGRAKAPVASPRKALGALAGNAVRFGEPKECLIIGEGIETVLSLRMVMASHAFAAALSAAHLGVFKVPPSTRRLYIAVDRDGAGLAAADTLQNCAVRSGVDARLLLPTRKDFNDDLLTDGAAALRERVARQLAPEDFRFVTPGR